MTQPIAREALSHLRALLRLDTTNPPGNEVVAIDYLRGVLEREGIACDTAESEPGRANLVARLPGRAKGARSRAVLMSSHVDVVPADAGSWSQPPFGAVISDGELYGRGAIDMKNMTAMALTAMLVAKRLDLALERDLVFAAVADEEGGCTHGSRFLVEKFPEWLESEYAVNELGGYTLHLNGRRFYPIQVAEKGLAWLRITAHGEPGHGSIPQKQNAIQALGAAIQKLSPRIFPHHTTPVVEEFVKTVSNALPAATRPVFRGVLDSRMGDFVLTRLLPDDNEAKVLWAMLHDSISPTVLEAGSKINVIPGSATLHVDCRVLPGRTPEQVMQIVQKQLGDGFTVDMVLSAPPTVVDHHNPFFTHLASALERADPGSKAVPFMIPGLTDARWYNELGIKTYGFAPVKLSPGVVFNKLFHGDDERIPVDGFTWGLETFLDALLSFAAGAEVNWREGDAGRG